MEFMFILFHICQIMVILINTQLVQILASKLLNYHLEHGATEAHFKCTAKQDQIALICFWQWIQQDYYSLQIIPILI